MVNENKTKYVILGLLSHEDLTGYDIKKRIDSSLKYFWGASYGSIYPTLNQLVGLKLVEKEELQESGRGKITYKINNSGRTFLKQWLEVPVERDEVRYETLVKLFFGNEIGSDQSILHVEAFRKKFEQEIPFLKQAVTVLKSVENEDEAHQYFMLTAMFGVKIFEAYVEWAKEAEALLGKKRDKVETPEI